MDLDLSFEQLKREIKPALISKVEEFHLLGYDDVREEDLWKYLTKKRWKKKEVKRLHEIVQDVMRVSVGDYMNFITVESYKQPNWFSKEGQEALKNLL